jgi:hypothetical protein
LAVGTLHALAACILHVVPALQALVACIIQALAAGILHGVGCLSHIAVSCCYHTSGGSVPARVLGKYERFSPSGFLFKKNVISLAAGERTTFFFLRLKRHLVLSTHHWDS